MNPNRGFIDQKLDIEDWHFGAVTGIESPILQPDGQWGVPLKEIQKQPWGDTQACVSFSALNCLEGLYQKRYGIELNFSDRFLAKVSGTKPTGNSMRKVADSIRDFGLVFEEQWPAPAVSWPDYYKDVSEEVLKQGELFKSEFLVQYDQVINIPSFMMEALKYSPLQVACYAYGPVVDGIYQRVEKDSNHCMMIYGYRENEYWLVYDHYENAFKKMAWDYYFRLIYRFNIENTMPNIPNIPNNKLVQCIDKDYQEEHNGEKHPDSGKVGIFLDGVILVDDTNKDKLIRTQQMRTVGQGLSAADWDKFPKKLLP